MSETQRYRVNYRLLASLVGGGVLAAAGLFGLWWFQVNRNADRLIARADIAEENSEFEEAFESLSQYVKLRPTEDEARLRLGKAALKLADVEDIEMRTRGEAYVALIDAVLKTGDPELRRKLVDVHMKYGFIDRASQTIEEILAAGKGDAELKALKAQCLFANQRSAEAANYCFKLIGFDRNTKTFDPKAAEAADRPMVYALLAYYLYGDKQTDLAKQVIDQMVAANPKSHEAFTFQYQVLKQQGDREAAKTALDKAYSLKPDDPIVLLSKGVEELQEYQLIMSEATGAEAEAKRKEAQAHLDAAAKFFAEGREKHPDRIAFFENAARVELASERIPEALAILDAGLKKFDLGKVLGANGVPQAIDLENLKIEILLSKNDIEGAKAQIQAVRNLRNSKLDPVAEFHDARVELQQQKWLDAARRLENVKAQLINFPNLQAMAGAFQGVAYSQVGMYDKAKEAYEWALERNPNLPQAQIGRDQMAQMMNQAPADGTAQDFDKVIQEILELPKEQQNWDLVTSKIDEQVEAQAKLRDVPPNWIAARKELLRAQMFASRALAAEDKAEKTRLFGEARTAITKAHNLDKTDQAVQLAVPRLIALEPDNGPKKALDKLEEIVAKRGDSPSFRLLRIELLAAINDEQLVNQLYAATESMDDWAPTQQAQVWAAAAARFEQLGKFPDALSCLEHCVELAPSILQYRMAMFELARKQGDHAAMLNAQEKVLELVKSKADPSYVLNEVRRLMWQFATGAITKEQLQGARPMVDGALKQRAGWADLHLASGQLYLVLEQNTAQALKAFDQALETGPANFNALALQVRMLADLGRFKEARERMDRAPKQAWALLFDQIGANILLRTGEKDAAFEQAKSVAARKPEDGNLQMWFAEIAAQSDRAAEAESAIKKAIELNPTEPDLWSGLLGFYMNARRGEDVEQALRDAQLSLDEEFLPLLMAKQHELFRRWPQSESILLSYYGDKLSTPPVARRMAEFYLNWGAQDPSREAHAAVYLNYLLRAANEGELQQDDPNVAWARRQAARLFAHKGNYQDSLRAEQLLDAAIAGRGATGEDQAQLVEILVLRGDPASLEQSVGLMRQLQQQGQLSAEGEARLGQALFDFGNWAECRAQMQDAISRHPKDANLRLAYIRMLLQKKDFATAERWITRLNDVESAAGNVAEMRLRLAAARGQKDEVRSILVAMTPNLGGAISPQQLQNLEVISNFADSVGDHEYALTVMRAFAQRTPGNELKLARLIALYGPLDEGITALKREFDGAMDDTLRIAVEMLRARRTEDPAKLDEAVASLVRQARHDDPESASRMVLEAETLEVQEHYDEAVAAYDKILARDDVPRHIRATALNNLSFILSLQKADLDRALSLVNEAIDSVGPISDILDTRGIVYHAKGDFSKAVEDLELCVKIGPTASKHFHLAAAQLAAGDRAGARNSWENAKNLGIAPEKVSKLEWDDLEEFQRQIEAQQSSAQLSGRPTP